MNILQLTAHFRPNVGGVETHLDDLCKALIKRNFNVIVLTYRPLQTSAKWKVFEKDKGLEIIRIPWLPKLFYLFVKIPILEFIYLLPGLFIITPFVIISKEIDVINAHGLVAGFVGVLWGKIFGKKIIVSTHSIYSFPKKGLYRNFVKFIFQNTDYCLGLSKQAVNEIKALGISDKKIKKFTYWIDLNKFKVKNSKLKVKKVLGWDYQFVVLFVGRLIPEKGVKELLESAKSWDRKINLKIIGSGPLEKKVREVAAEFINMEFIEGIDSKRLPIYYSGSDLLIVPSTSEEGFGRVILEALACGVPVVGSNLGAIPEAMDQSVGRIIEINEENIKNTVEYFYYHKSELRKLAQNCRKFAERRYSEKNVEKIIKIYTN